MNNIKKLRVKRNITQVDLANKIKVKQETINQKAFDAPAYSI